LAGVLQYSLYRPEGNLRADDAASKVHSEEPQLALPSYAEASAIRLNVSTESEGPVTRGLTRREMLVLRSLMEGASNKVIALKLVMTESTVKVHIKAILCKLRLQNRTQAAMWARDHASELADARESLERRNSGTTNGWRMCAPGDQAQSTCAAA
jgi:DNA-binding NarL/FixJ family response regulator